MISFEEFMEARAQSKKPDQIIEVKNINEVYANLLRLSLEGGAWAFSILPFSGTVSFYRYDSPSKVPDWFYDSMRTNEYPNGAIGWRGGIVPFTKAAVIRDQQRGYGRD
jgi:hypothetical protein